MVDLSQCSFEVATKYNGYFLGPFPVVEDVVSKDASPEVS